MKVPTLTISKLPLWSLGTKCHLDMGLVERHKVYYKGEGGCFPQIWAVMSLVNSSYTWLVLALKVFQLCTNHFVLVLCKPVWISEACQYFLVPSRSSSMPLYPSKVLWSKERAVTPYSSVVLCLEFTFESFKELGARQHALNPCSHTFDSSFPCIFLHICPLHLKSTKSLLANTLNTHKPRMEGKK